MSDHDLPPELRQRNRQPEALPIELPVDDEVTPPLPKPNRTSVDEQCDSEPFLRRS
jgi:hypothetical protein